MLSFDIRSLESHAVVVDEDLSADDPVWQEEDPKPAGAVHVTGRLSAAGSGPVLLARPNRRGRRARVQSLSRPRRSAHVERRSAPHLRRQRRMRRPTIPTCTCWTRQRSGARPSAGDPRAVAARGADVRAVPGRLQGALPAVWRRPERRSARLRSARSPTRAGTLSAS